MSDTFTMDAHDSIVALAFAIEKVEDKLDGLLASGDKLHQENKILYMDEVQSALQGISTQLLSVAKSLQLSLFAEQSLPK